MKLPNLLADVKKLSDAELRECALSCTEDTEFLVTLIKIRVAVGNARYIRLFPQLKNIGG